MVEGFDLLNKLEFIMETNLSKKQEKPAPYQSDWIIEALTQPDTLGTPEEHFKEVMSYEEHAQCYATLDRAMFKMIDSLYESKMSLTLDDVNDLQILKNLRNLHLKCSLSPANNIERSAEDKPITICNSQEAAQSSLVNSEIITHQN